MRKLTPCLSSSFYQEQVVQGCQLWVILSGMRFWCHGLNHAYVHVHTHLITCTYLDSIDHQGLKQHAVYTRDGSGSINLRFKDITWLHHNRRTLIQSRTHRFIHSFIHESQTCCFWYQNYNVYFTHTHTVYQPNMTMNH